MMKEQWDELTDNDLDVIAGREEQLVGALQKRYGMLREDAQHAIREWLDRCDVTRDGSVSRRGL